MSIFKKLKSVFEKREETKGPQSMRLEEMESWVEEKIKKETDGGIDGCNPLVQEIEEVKADALKIIKEIDEKKFSEEIEKRMYKPVKTAKPIYVTGMRKALRHIKTKDLQDYQDLLSFQKSFVNSLKTVDSFQRGTGRHVTFVYREEMAMIGTELNSLIDLSNKLKETIEKIEAEVNELEEISSNIKEIKTLEEKKQEKTTRKKTIAEKKDELKEEETTLRKEQDTLEKSNEFKQFQSIQKKVEKQKEEKTKLKTQMYNQLHPLKRVFKKYKRIAEKGDSKLNKGDLDILQDYIEEPVQTFLSKDDKKDLALLKILEGAEKSIKNGDLQLKAKETNKTLDRLNLLEKNCKDMKDTYEEIIQKEKSLKDQLSGFNVTTKRDELQKKIKRVKEDMDILEKEGIDVEKETSEREKKTEKLLKDIESQATDIMGQGIKIQKNALNSNE